MVEIIHEFDLTQVVQEPTRGHNILDIVFTSNLVNTPNVLHGMSDHSLVLFSVKAKLKHKPKNPRAILLFNKGDMNSVKADLRNKLEEFTLNAKRQSVNENWVSFRNIITDSIKRNIPSKILHGKRHQPWITSEIKRLIRVKQRRYNTAKRFGKSKDWENFRQTRSQIHKKLRNQHKIYVNGLLENADEDQKKAKVTKRFWKYVASKRKDNSGISTLRRDDGTATTDAKEIADLLNKQYKNVFTLENPELPKLKPSDTPSMRKITITVNGVKKQLQTLDASKSTGPDNIPTRVLKETANETAPYLTEIFQQSLDQGCVPDDWKHANVSAVFKKGRRDVPSNYRPISLTSVSCKILEHIIFHHIMEHLEQHNILVDTQHGFRKHRSCETQLINTLETVAQLYDTKHQIDLVVLDFSKAFDTVAHKRLCLKLDHVGIRDITHTNTSCEMDTCNGECEQQLLKWFKSWLFGRTQRVIFDGQSSDVCHVTSGVPQGTVLGPLCFLIYINDIADNLSHDTHLKLFADDSLIFRAISSIHDSITLQQDIDSQMKFHPSKCQVMTVCRKKKPHQHDYDMQGHRLSHVNSIQYLGVNIQNNLQWNKHIHHITSKAN